jgi:transposase
MMLLPTGTSVRIHIAAGVTDMRKGMDGLAMLVQSVLGTDPFSGHLFAFRGRKSNMIKIVFWDGNGPCLFTKRLDHPIGESLSEMLDWVPATLRVIRIRRPKYACRLRQAQATATHRYPI